MLDSCDGSCPNQHYSKTFAKVLDVDILITDNDNNMIVDIMRHPLVCFNGSGCTSTLRIFRSASTLFGVACLCMMQ